MKTTIKCLSVIERGVSAFSSQKYLEALNDLSPKIDSLAIENNIIINSLDSGTEGDKKVLYLKLKIEAEGKKEDLEKFAKALENEGMKIRTAI